MKEIAFHFLCGQFPKGDQAYAEAEKRLSDIFASSGKEELRLALDRAAELEKAGREFGRQCRLGTVTETRAREELEKSFSDFPPKTLDSAIAHGFFADRWLEFCQENKVDAESRYFCPVCMREEKERSTCPDCGLWWFRPSSMPKTAKNHKPGSLPTLDLILPEYPHPVELIFMLFAIFIGFGLNLLTVSNLSSNPSSWPLWLSLFFGLPIAGGIGTIFLMSFIKVVLRIIAPSELHGKPEFLFVKMWDTWDEPIFKGFRRISTKIPTHQIEGFEIFETQDGRSNLVLLHSSGKAFGIGWRGSKKQAEKYGEQILSWLAAQEGNER